MAIQVKVVGTGQVIVLSHKTTTVAAIKAELRQFLGVPEKHQLLRDENERKLCDKEKIDGNRNLQMSLQMKGGCIGLEIGGVQLGCCFCTVI